MSRFRRLACFRHVFDIFVCLFSSFPPPIFLALCGLVQVVSIAGSSLLKSAVDCGAMTIDNTFCLTGQCEACMTQLDGEVVLSCMVPVPADGR